MEACKSAILFDIYKMTEDSPEPELYMGELFHAVRHLTMWRHALRVTTICMLCITFQAAFKGNTVGLPRFPTEQQLNSTTDLDLLSYMKTYHTPERMVLTAVGVDHDELVDLAKKYFLRTPIWDERDGVKVGKEDKSIAQYTGGIIKVRHHPQK